MATQLPENETSSDHAAGPRTKVTERWQRRERGGGSPPSPGRELGQRAHLLATLMPGASALLCYEVESKEVDTCGGDAGVGAGVPRAGRHAADR